MNKFETNKTIGKEIQYFKSTHYVRLELWRVVEDIKTDSLIAQKYTVNVGDKIKDQNGKEYDVKFIYENPWFGGSADHLVL
jgi:hypothetical protein